MSITAIVEGNSIKLPPGTNLPDGTTVRVEIATGSRLSDDLANLIGSWEEDPTFDAAVQAFEQADKSAWG